MTWRSLPANEPGSDEWDFSRVDFGLDDDLVAIGADLEPDTLVSAYRHGMFPMGLGDGGMPPMGWWSPLERGVLERDDLKVSRSLRRAVKTFDVTFDHDFDAVISACAEPSRDGAWITEDIINAYTRLHALGWAHSVEVWKGTELVGGLYGVALGGLFAGESMFHHATDASKVALCALHEVVFADRNEPRLIDVQWRTDHLASLGASSLSRAAYRTRLPDLVGAAPILPPGRGA